MPSTESSSNMHPIRFHSKQLPLWPALLLLVLATTAYGTSPSYQVEDYFPLETGVFREYQMLGSGGMSVGDFTEEIVEVDDNGYAVKEIASNLEIDGMSQQGTATYRERFNSAGERIVASFDVEQRVDGTLVAATSRNYDEPTENFSTFVLGEERRIATTFSESGTNFLGDPVERTGTEEMAVTLETFESISVPAGTFETARLAITVTTTYDDEPESPLVDEEVHWVAEGIGAVRIDYSDRMGDPEEPHHQNVLVDHSTPNGAPDDDMSFSDWADGYGLPEGQNAPEAAPAGDGIANALKYALGLDPTRPARREMPAKSIEEVDGDDFMAMAIARSDSTQGVTFIVEVSDDLQVWESGPEHTEVMDDTESLLRVRDTTPVSETDERFIRLRIELTGEF